jgi:hypothetical protein
MTKKKGYSVGYGKPPKHSRFKPGQSGNPKGRPKGAQSDSSLLQAELKRSVAITENGRSGKLSKRAVMIRNLVNKAMGDIRAAQIVIAMSEKAQNLSPLRSSEQEMIDKFILDDYVRRQIRAAENAPNE